MLEQIDGGLLIAAGDAEALRQPVALARLVPPEADRLAVVVAGPVTAMVPGLATGLRPWIRQGWQSVRLVGSCAAAPDGGSSPAQELADRLGVEVIAPDGSLLAVPDGSLFVVGGSDAERSGAWWRLRPERAPVAGGARFPSPGWEPDLAAVADPGLPGVVVQQIPAGLWVRRTGQVALTDLAFAMPADAHAVALLVSRPGDAPVPAMQLLRVVATLPHAIREQLVVVPYGDEPVAGVRLGPAVAAAAEYDVRVRAGPAIQVDRRRRRVVAVDGHGAPTWRPFVRELLWSPDGGPPEVARWAKRVGGLISIGPGHLALDRRWLVELIASGLWVRPLRQSSGTRLVREIPLDASHCTVVVGAPGGGRMRPPWRAIVQLLRRLPADAQARLRLTVPDDAGEQIARAAARACGHELAGRPVYVLDAYGEVTPRYVATPPGWFRAWLGRTGPVVRIEPPPPSFVQLYGVESGPAAGSGKPSPAAESGEHGAGTTPPRREDGDRDGVGAFAQAEEPRYHQGRSDDGEREPVAADASLPREPPRARGTHEAGAVMDMDPVVHHGGDYRRQGGALAAADVSTAWDEAEAPSDHGQQRSGRRRKRGPADTPPSTASD